MERVVAEKREKNGGVLRTVRDNIDTKNMATKLSQPIRNKGKLVADLKMARPISANQDENRLSYIFR